MSGHIREGIHRAGSMLMALLLAAGVTGCGDKPASDADAPSSAVTVTQDAAEIDRQAAEEVELRLVGCRFDERQELKVLWVNSTGREVTWGEPYGLYRQEADGWKAVDGEGEFLAIGYVLRPGQESAHTYDLTIYNPLYHGIYRLETHYFFNDIERPITEADQHPVSVTFQVGRPIEGRYRFDRSLYVHPASSFLPHEGGMPDYRIQDGMLSAIDAAGKEKLLGTLRAKPLIDPEKAKAKLEEAQKYMVYPIADHVYGCKLPIEKPGDCFFYETEADAAGIYYQLYDVSGTLWLSQMRDEEAWMVVGLRAAG